MGIGSALAILGLWKPGSKFEYALVQGGFNGKSYIKVMDWVAHKAAQTLAETGRLTVVVKMMVLSTKVALSANI
jgi:putative transposase